MSVDYNRLADRFDERYQHRDYAGVWALLKQLSEPPVKDVLEVGCGTGHWLSMLGAFPLRLFGTDPSFGMLARARSKLDRVPLVCAPAERLPFHPKSFNLVFCVNAFHHFRDPKKFLGHCAQQLRVGGRLAIIGLDPHLPQTKWYLYDFFRGTREIDRKRFLPHAEIHRLMAEAGFQKITTVTAEHLKTTLVGRQVLGDPFLERTSTSQLQLISEEDYAAGRSSIASALERAEESNQILNFEVDLTISATIGSADR